MDVLCSKKGKLSRVEEGLNFKKASFYDEPGAYLPALNRRDLTAEDLAIDIDLNNSKYNLKDMYDMLMKMEIQHRKF